MCKEYELGLNEPFKVKASTYINLLIQCLLCGLDFDSVISGFPHPQCCPTVHVPNTALLSAHSPIFSYPSSWDLPSATIMAL